MAHGLNESQGIYYYMKAQNSALEMKIGATNGVRTCAVCFKGENMKA